MGRVETHDEWAVAERRYLGGVHGQDFRRHHARHRGGTAAITSRKTIDVDDHNGGVDLHHVAGRDRYRRGYQRLWYPPEGGGNDLIVHLYEFCDAKGAAGYLRHTRERLLSPLWGSVEIDVVLPGHEVALLQKGDSGGGSFGAVLRGHGRFYVEVGAYGGPPGEELGTLFARAGALNAAQVAGLP